LEKNPLLISSLPKKLSKRQIKLFSYWSLELISLYKAFFTYKKKKNQKVHVLKNTSLLLWKKKSNTFLYNFMKLNIFLIPYLKSFFDGPLIRDKYIPISSLFDILESQEKMAPKLGKLILFFKLNNEFIGSTWLSIYKLA